MYLAWINKLSIFFDEQVYHTRASIKGKDTDTQTETRKHTQKRRQEVDIGLNVRVQKNEHGASGGPRTQQPSADQALALLCAHHTHLVIVDREYK